jgi:hypothetical protein
MALERVRAVKVHGDKIAPILQIMQETLPKIRKVSDFARLVELGIPEGSKEYWKALSDFTRTNVGLFAKEGYSGSVAEFEALKKLFSWDPDTLEAIIRASMTYVRSTREFFQAYAVSGTLTDAQKGAFSRAVRDWVKRLVELGGTLEDLERVKKDADRIDTCIAAMEAGLPLVKSPEDYRKLVGPGISNPNKEYLDAIVKFVQSHPVK